MGAIVVPAWRHTLSLSGWGTWSGLRERQLPAGLAEPIKTQDSVGQVDILASPQVPWGLSDLARGLWHVMEWCLRTSLAPSPPPPVVSRDSALLSSSLLSSLRIPLFSKGLGATCGLAGNCCPPEVSRANLRLRFPASSCMCARALLPPGFSHLRGLWGPADPRFKFYLLPLTAV